MTIVPNEVYRISKAQYANDLTENGARYTLEDRITKDRAYFMQIVVGHWSL